MKEEGNNNPDVIIREVMKDYNSNSTLRNVLRNNNKRTINK